MFDWGEFVAVAELLADARVTHHAGSEARTRAAVSRAYYAAFGVVLARASELEVYSPSGDRDHSALPLVLQRNGGRPGRQLAGYLQSLKQARHWADYDKPSLPPMTAADAIELARKAIACAAGWKRG